MENKGWFINLILSFLGSLLVIIVWRLLWDICISTFEGVVLFLLLFILFNQGITYKNKTPNKKQRKRK